MEEQYSALIIELIQRIAGTYGLIPVKTFDATVVSVDESTRTCIVNNEKDNIDNIKVRYMSEISDGVCSVPEIQSSVVVISTGVTEPYIVSKSWITKHNIIVGSQGYLNNGEKQIFNDGTLGGLVIIQELRDSLDSIKSYVTGLTSAVQTALGTVDTSAGSASAPSFSTTMSSKTIEIKSMENTSITHGDKLPS